MRALIAILSIGVALNYATTYAQNVDNSNSHECGKIRGDNFAHNPWIAKVYFKSDTDKIYLGCAAVLVSKRHLLVPAHCILGDSDTLREPHLIILGDINAQLYEIAEIALHPNITFGSQIASTSRLITDNDIAIMSLKRNADVAAADVQPICLASVAESSLDYEDQQLLYAGYPILGPTNTKVFVWANISLESWQFPEISKNLYISISSGLSVKNKIFSGSPLMGVRTTIDGKKRMYMIGLGAGIGGAGIEFIIKLSPHLKWIKENVV